MSLQKQFVKGTCTMMCPETESRMREREGLLHKFEMIPASNECGYPRADFQKTVKMYSRCAAGQATPKAYELRSPEALKTTVKYLLQEIVSESSNWCDIYDFVFDRLRAVRQDAVIQDLDVHNSIHLLKPIVRFLAYSGYRMCEEPLQRYDPEINFHHFTDCLKKLLNLYDTEDCYRKGKIKDTFYIFERSQFEAMYQITFLGQAEAISRGFMLEKHLRTPLVNLAIEISCAQFGGNYVRVCRKITYLSPLLLCVVSLQLPKIRRFALLVMNVAFSSRNLSYPLTSLRSLLLYRSEDDLMKDCQNYGIPVKDQNVVFQKGNFNECSPVTSPSTLKLIDDELKKHKLSQLLMKTL